MEMKNSYKNMLDGQVNQKNMHKEIEFAERNHQSTINNQRHEMQRQQDSQMRMLKQQQ